MATRRSAPSSSADDLLGPLEDGVRLAAELGDRRAEADFGTRLAVLEASRLRLTDARRRAEQVLARARAADSEDGVVLALDGAKTVAWYLGDADALADAVEELEPLVRARQDAWLLQWVVFESAFVPAAHDRWDEARDRVAQALDLNRRSGFPAYAGHIRSYDGWLARWAGDLDEASRLGRRAVEDDVGRRPSLVALLGRRAARRDPGPRPARRPRRRRWPGPGWPRGAARRARGGCCAPRRSRP